MLVWWNVHIIYHSILEQNIILNLLVSSIDLVLATHALPNWLKRYQKSLDDCKQADVIFMDFAKAFITFKVKSYGITGRMHHWLSQRRVNKMN